MICDRISFMFCRFHHQTSDPSANSSSPQFGAKLQQTTAAAAATAVVGGYQHQPQHHQHQHKFDFESLDIGNRKDAHLHHQHPQHQQQQQHQQAVDSHDAVNRAHGASTPQAGLICSSPRSRRGSSADNPKKARSSRGNSPVKTLNSVGTEPVVVPVRRRTRSSSAASNASGQSSSSNHNPSPPQPPSLTDQSLELARQLSTRTLRSGTTYCGVPSLSQTPPSGRAINDKRRRTQSAGQTSRTSAPPVVGTSTTPSGTVPAPTASLGATSPTKEKKKSKSRKRRHSVDPRSSAAESSASKRSVGVASSGPSANQQPVQGPSSSSEKRQRRFGTVEPPELEGLRRSTRTRTTGSCASSRLVLNPTAALADVSRNFWQATFTSRLLRVLVGDFLFHIHGLILLSLNVNHGTIHCQWI